MPTERGIRRAFVLAATVLLGDVLTKATIAALIELGAGHAVLPGLNIVHVLNRGAASSFLHDAGGWQRGFFIALALVAAVVLVLMIRRPGTALLERVSYGLILGGALGNMVDRVARGAVVDWIDLYWGDHHWPAFNVADIGISCGAVLLVIGALFFQPRPLSQG